MSKFMAFGQTYQESEVVLFGAPFDGTASLRPGSRFAPPHIRTYSEGIETYSPYQERDLEEIPLHDAGDLPLFSGSADVQGQLDQIEGFVAKVLKESKKPLMIGGDHLTSLPAIQAAYNTYPDLCVIQLDAHTDLAESFLDNRLSHAAVMRRCWEFLGDGRIFQLGMRSGPKEEFEWAKSHTHLYPFNLEAIDRVLEQIGERPVYLTLDIDLLDPSVVSGTGTPEPGGVMIPELLKALLSCRGAKIIGADLVELAPHYDRSDVSTLVACMLIRELALLEGLSHLPMNS